MSGEGGVSVPVVLLAVCCLFGCRQVRLMASEGEGQPNAPATRPRGAKGVSQQFRLPPRIPFATRLTAFSASRNLRHRLPTMRRRHCAPALLQSELSCGSPRRPLRRFPLPVGGGPYMEQMCVSRVDVKTWARLRHVTSSDQLARWCCSRSARSSTSYTVFEQS